jgi:hypothetical protein
MSNSSLETTTAQLAAEGNNITTTAQLAAEGGEGVNEEVKYSQVLRVHSCTRCNWYSNPQRSIYEETFTICPICYGKVSFKVLGQYIYNIRDEIIGVKING